MSSNFAALSKIAIRRPLVLTCHGAILGFWGWKRVMEGVFNATVGKWTLRSADKVIALTPTQAGILQALGAGRSQLVVIPIWVDPNQIDVHADAQEFRSRYELDDRKIVLFVGRLLPIKGLQYLIEAVRYAKTRPRIVIIGGEAQGYPGNKRDLEDQAKALEVDGDISFLGSFPRSDLAEAYLAADLFVLPSLGEGLPMALLEAMAYGKCVVATRVPGNIDVVKDGWNGILVEPKNPRELASKIDYLLTDEEIRERLGAQARRDVEQNYSSDIIISKIVNLYHDVQRKRVKT